MKCRKEWQRGRRRRPPADRPSVRVRGQRVATRGRRCARRHRVARHICQARQNGRRAPARARQVSVTAQECCREAAREPETSPGTARTGWSRPAADARSAAAGGNAGHEPGRSPRQPGQHAGCFPACHGEGSERPEARKATGVRHGSRPGWRRHRPAP